MLDDGLQKPWPDDVLPAAKRFQLGDVIKSPPFFFAGDPKRPLWVPPGRGDEEIVSVPEDARPPYGILVTQTCDLHDRTESQPFFEISPVYDMPEGMKRKGYFHPLDGPALGHGNWMADLRVTLSLEKGLLVGREPIRGFADEDGEVEFAALLGQRRDRAALHDAINQVLYREFDRKLSNNKNLRAAVREELQVVMLAVAEGNRSEPRAVKVYFYSNRGEFSERVHEFLESWWTSASEKAEQHAPQLRLVKNGYRDGSACDLAEYSSLIPLDW
jgi:hypothetical protein